MYAGFAVVTSWHSVLIAQKELRFHRKEMSCEAVAYPGILFGGGSTKSVEDRGQREWGSGGSRTLVRGSGGSCNLVQEISFHIVKFSLIFYTLRLFMMTTNLALLM